MSGCTKAYYPDQGSARVALTSIREKARSKLRSGKLPVRVYPCDQCNGWHLTAKAGNRKQPPWDLDPNWTRPGATGHLQDRSGEWNTRPSRRRRV